MGWLSIFSNQLKVWLLVFILVITIGVRIPGLLARSIWYDEAITLLQTAGHARISLPKEPTPAHVLQERFFKGTPSLSQIATDLRKTDVHPPVYYWILTFWRRWFGFSLETARVYSLICSVGSVFVLYLLLQASRIQTPLIPTLIYALSSTSVHFGQEARAYAQATLLMLMGALFAYLSTETENHKSLHRLGQSMAMAICCGLAFLSNYLTLFPVCIILLWFSFNLWKKSRILSLLSPLFSILIWLSWWPALREQLSARPSQAQGFIGILSEIKAIIFMNFRLIYGLISRETLLRYGAYGLICILFAITLFRIFMYWSELNQKFIILMLGMGIAPSVGIFAMNLLSNKQLHITRYIMLAGPALCVLLTYGATSLKFSMRYIGAILISMLIFLQISTLNWGSEKTPGFDGSENRSLANTIKNSSLSSPIVIAGRGNGDWWRISSLLYELDPDTMFIALQQGSDFNTLGTFVKKYDAVWIVTTGDAISIDRGKQFVDLLLRSGDYIEIDDAQAEYFTKATQLRRVRPLN